MEVRTERMRCEENELSSFRWGSPNAAFLCLQKSTFLPSRQNRYQIAVK